MQSTNSATSRFKAFAWQACMYTKQPWFRTWVFLFLFCLLSFEKFHWSILVERSIYVLKASRRQSVHSKFSASNLLSSAWYGNDVWLMSGWVKGALPRFVVDVDCTIHFAGGVTHLSVTSDSSHLWDFVSHTSCVPKWYAVMEVWDPCDWLWQWDYLPRLLGCRLGPQRMAWAV